MAAPGNRALHRHAGLPHAVQPGCTLRTGAKKLRRHGRERARAAQIIKHSVKISRRLCFITMVAQTKGRARTSALAHASTRFLTLTRSCYYMNDSCSVTAPAPWKSLLMMLSTDGKRRERKKKRISQKIWESCSHWGGKWVVRTLRSEKSSVTFNEKGENKHNVENLESSKLSAAAEDCESVMNGKRREKEQ